MEGWMDGRMKGGGGEREAEIQKKRVIAAKRFKHRHASQGSNARLSLLPSLSLGRKTLKRPSNPSPIHPLPNSPPESRLT